jgi:ABC-type antimicrobial peptide transport system permease subunit
MDFQMSRTIETNNNVITIFGFIGFFAALMSGTGLFTLVSLTILRRIKEIGIRKVLGSSVPRLAGVISYEFIIILLFACLAGGAIGYVMVDFSLDAAWEYYEKVGPRTIGLSVGIMLLLALLTVGLKIVNAARMNPVQNLRSE